MKKKNGAAGPNWSRSYAEMLAAAGMAESMGFTKVVFHELPRVRGVEFAELLVERTHEAVRPSTDREGVVFTPLDRVAIVARDRQPRMADRIPRKVAAAMSLTHVDELAEDEPVSPEIGALLMQVQFDPADGFSKNVVRGLREIHSEHRFAAIMEYFAHHLRGLCLLARPRYANTVLDEIVLTARRILGNTLTEPALATMLDRHALQAIAADLARRCNCP